MCIEVSMILRKEPEHFHHCVSAAGHTAAAAAGIDAIWCPRAATATKAAVCTTSTSKGSAPKASQVGGECSAIRSATCASKSITPLFLHWTSQEVLTSGQSSND